MQIVRFVVWLYPLITHDDRMVVSICVTVKPHARTGHSFKNIILLLSLRFEDAQCSVNYCYFISNLPFLQTYPCLKKNELKGCLDIN